MKCNRVQKLSSMLVPTLLMCTGLSSSVFAQDRGTQDQPTRTRPMQDGNMQTQSPAQSSVRMLCYFSDLRGKNVKGANNDTIFEIKDVIFDRHSGDIAAFVVSDDRVVTLQDVQSTLDEDGGVALRTALTKDALKAKPEFDKDVFTDKVAKDEKAAAWWNRFASESGKQVRSESTTYQPERLKSTDKVEVVGKIDEIERVRGEGDVYRAIAIIREKDGNTRTVILGPTWYLADARALPMRGQSVKLTAVPIESDSQQWAATSMSIDGGKSVTLREGESLSPTWYKNGNMDVAASVQSRMLLASGLMGDDVKSREDSTGEVENLVIDHLGGRVVALVIDPNEAWLGVNDTTRLIPISVASPSGDNMVFIDATKDMIVGAPAAPNKLNEMNNSWRLDEMYKQRPISNR